MSEPESIDGVRYHAVDAAYFEKRGLRKYAGVWSLWALGVGAVISGDFFGWNFGLAAGGFGGLFIATLIVVVMYLGPLLQPCRDVAGPPAYGRSLQLRAVGARPLGRF